MNGCKWTSEQQHLVSVTEMMRRSTKSCIFNYLMDQINSSTSVSACAENNSSNHWSPYYLLWHGKRKKGRAAAATRISEREFQRSFPKTMRLWWPGVVNRKELFSRVGKLELELELSDTQRNWNMRRAWLRADWIAGIATKGYFWIILVRGGDDDDNQKNTHIDMINKRKSCKFFS